MYVAGDRIGLTCMFGITFMMQEALLAFNAFILAYSVVKIRKTVKKSKNAFPNEALVCVHVFNSILFALIWLAYSILYFSG